MPLNQGAYRLAESPETDPAGDAMLVRRCQAGDDAAFNDIVERYQDRIFSYVKRMVRDPGEAEDVAQEVFVKAYQGLKGFDGRASLGTWVFRIATNLCVDHSRRKSRRIEPVSLSGNGLDEDLQHDVPDRKYDPERLVMEGEMRGVVEKAVGRLSDKLRTVLLLHDMNNLSYEEIATVVKVPLGTVKSRLFLARTQLRDALREYMREGELA